METSAFGFCGPCLFCIDTILRVLITTNLRLIQSPLATLAQDRASHEPPTLERFVAETAILRLASDWKEGYEDKQTPKPSLPSQEKLVTIGVLVAEAIKWSMKQIPFSFMDAVGSVIQTLATFKEEHDKCLGVARVADFATIAAIEEDTDGVHRTIERTARYLIRSRRYNERTLARAVSAVCYILVSGSICVAPTAASTDYPECAFALLDTVSTNSRSTRFAVFTSPDNNIDYDRPGKEANTTTAHVRFGSLPDMSAPILVVCILESGADRRAPSN
jgi:hypothetical protein